MQTFKVVSDLVCPWCYIGKRRLEAAIKELPDGAEASVSWHAFQLNPDMAAEGMDRREYCTQKFGSWERCEEMFAQIAEVGKTVGLRFRFDRQAAIPNTFDAHRVIWLAGLEEAQDEVVEALFRAYFCEGVDLTSRGNLIEVAASAGLAKRRVQEMFDSKEGVAEVQTEEQAVKTLGVSSVPLFIIHDRVAVSGAQPPETLVKAFMQAEQLLRRQKRSAAKLNPSCSRMDS